MRVLLTGGHLSPLLAVIAELEQRTDIELIVASRRYSIEGSKAASVESTILQQHNVPVAYITTGRLQRHFSRHTIPSLFKIPIGFFQALHILRKTKPQVVVSFGGYVSVPVILAAWLLRIPSITHEQSVQVGLANTINSMFASKVAVSWQSSLPFFPKKKTVVTGNPIRKSVFKTTPQHPDIVHILSVETSRPLIYITGGNQGSHSINQVVFTLIPQLVENYRIIHQVGGTAVEDYQQAQAIKARLTVEQAKRYLPTPFINDQDIGAVFHEAKLLIGRAGANTVTETAAIGVPAIFIPLPWAQKQEQLHNARLLTAVGHALILEQKELTSEKLMQVIAEVFAHYDVYKSNAQAAKQLVHANAASLIAELIISVQKKHE